MKKTLYLIIIVFGTFFVNAQVSDIDMTKIQAEIDEYGMPTISSVDEMLVNADKLYDTQNWQDAADAYSLFAKNANWLANLISNGLEPYYSATYDEKKSVSNSVITPLTKYESLSNYYKVQRNKAILRQGICFFNLNDNKASLPYILKALDLIGVEDLDQWKEARDILYAIIKFE